MDLCYPNSNDRPNGFSFFGKMLEDELLCDTRESANHMFQLSRTIRPTKNMLRGKYSPITNDVDELQLIKIITWVFNKLVTKTSVDDHLLISY